MTRTYHLLSLVIVAATMSACGAPDTASTANDTEKASETVPVVFGQSDMRGLWRFTVEGVENDAEYDANGAKMSGKDPLPSSFSISSEGSVDGSFSQSGGSGWTSWMRRWTYAGHMANDKQQISGSCTERFSTTDGSDTDTYEWSAVKTGEGTVDVATGASSSPPQAAKRSEASAASAAVESRMVRFMQAK